MTEKIRIFLSYAREDESAVKELYQRLSDEGFEPWMDRQDILPGERWDTSIESAIQKSDFFLACLSTRSVGKRGVIQRELEDALNAWQGMSLHDIYLIPVRLEECDIPRILRHLQWLDLFEVEGWARLLKAIQVGMKRRAEAVSSSEVVAKVPVQEPEPPIPVSQIAASLRHGWVMDPWYAEDPYAALEDLFVGPRSSMQEIRSSLRGERTEAQERAWARLQDLPRRLSVDAFLYRVERGPELLATLREHLATDQRLPSVRQIPPLLKNEWPLILLLAGMREECLSAWTDLLRTAGERTDPAIVHSLAIAHTSQAQRQEEEGQADAAIASWRRAIGYWVWILDKDGYWEAWAAGRAQCYQERITPQHVSDLRQQLDEHLRGRFAERGGRLPRDWPAETQRSYRELGLEWHIEGAGLQALKQVQAGQPGSKKVSPEAGPLLVYELDLQQRLAQLVLDRTTEADDVVFLLTASPEARQARQSTQDVRFYFSQLGRAVAWLDLLQPERALGAMPAVEEGEDSELNAPYSLLQDRQVVWGKDRAELVMRAHLQLANSHLNHEPWEVEAIVAEWTEVVSQSGPLGDADLAIGMIQDQVLAYAHPIADNPSKQRQQLALVEAAKQVIGSTPRLDSHLKKLQGALQARESAEEATAEAPLDLESLLDGDREGAEPLHRSWQSEAHRLHAVLEANPADGEAREELVRLLAERLEQLIYEDQLDEARQVVGEWYDKLDRPPSLQEPYQYIKSGHKVESYLAQADLSYIPDLLKAGSYELPCRTQHSANLVASLQVEGDLVRIHAPVHKPVDTPDSDTLRNLLRATWGMPLYKAYRRPEGDSGLMVEVLAHSLNPALLRHLIEYLIVWIDLSSSRLKSYDSLEALTGQPVPDLWQREGEPLTEDHLERRQRRLLTLCQQMDLRCTFTGGGVYQLRGRKGQGAAIELDLQAPVVTLHTLMGGRYQMGRRVFERMMSWNYLTRLCKLALAPGDEIAFRCEVPDLDEEGTLGRLLSLAFDGLAQAESLLAWHML